ncbi:2Fe-2S iron-sulfur cluster binding domain-containing protein [Aneurinibacillus tyrosinisolvens]|uniref:2Fe-2S iron-sulfur cluster binding domain-containing protein n=1 Tax=Aneurinibacillus tyrosinisolvens TaxID=1443435 RepID=UPI0009E1EC56|nr:2Fe-2S iron-sulfur cluster binding domain-containing protein [Aneurinibacillus tyrosinisolvens]
MFRIDIVDPNSDKSQFMCDSKQSLLDAARMQGIKIPFACKGGGCGICKINIEEGAFERGPSSKEVLPDTERALKFTLACKTYPRSDMKVRLRIAHNS